MNIVCLDMEGVLGARDLGSPSQRRSGIPELRRTTRDEPDYDKLMTLAHGHSARARSRAEATFRTPLRRIDPLPGARGVSGPSCATTAQAGDPQRHLRSSSAQPLMEKLGWPTTCRATRWRWGRTACSAASGCGARQSKLTTVRACQSMGFETIASGDSYNDLEMIRASKAGFLFRTDGKDQGGLSPVSGLRGV